MEQIVSGNSPQKLMIINRSFWPRYHIVGDALLYFSEMAKRKGLDVYVVIQDPGTIQSCLSKAARGEGIKFLALKALSSSSSNLFFRIIELFIFSFWVAWSLMRVRPQKIYVSTDPPILIPLIVLAYSRLMRCQFYYHLQDIHPEVGVHVYGKKNILMKLMIKVDSLTMKYADRLATITSRMKKNIKERSKTKVEIVCIDNPALGNSSAEKIIKKRNGVIFCGNAGRLQLIPLIMQSVDEFYNRGGRLPVVFAGEGVYAKELLKFSKKHRYCEYLGVVSASEASSLVSLYKWGLLPIKDEATDFAFPSKSSTYIMNDTNILAIANLNSFISSWVTENRVGVCIIPKVENIVDALFKIENEELGLHVDEDLRGALKHNLQINTFVEKMCRFVDL